MTNKTFVAKITVETIGIEEGDAEKFETFLYDLYDVSKIVTVIIKADDKSQMSFTLYDE